MATGKANQIRRALVVALTAFPVAGVAAPPPRIAWFSPGTAENQGHYETAFKQGMRDNGLAEGRDYVLEVQYAAGHYERFPSMIAEALARQPAVLVGVTIPSIKAAQQATRSVPIVFISTTDPVGNGLVASLSRPGGNTTGVSNQAQSAITKYVDLVREALPSARRIAVLLNPANTFSVGQFELLRAFAQEGGMSAAPFEARTPEDLDATFAAIARHRPDVLLLIADSMLFEVHKRIVAFAREQRLPTIAPTPEHGASGMLFAYGASRPEMYRRAATYVARILNGARPADLPVEQPTRFELVVNLRTAEALAVKVPYSVMLRADRVIE
jgi:putative ABC transport system substrate-binding protein